MIYINGRFLTQRITGVQRFGIEVVRELDKLVDENEIEILSPPNIINKIELKKIRVTIIGKKSNNFWVQCVLPLYVKRHKGVLLTMSGMIPVLCPDYYVAHDAMFIRFPKTFSKLFAFSYSISFYIALKKCKKIFTVSNFSKNELIDIFNIRKDMFILVSPSSMHLLNEKYEEISINKWGLKKNQYYLNVSSQTLHKNQKYIFKCAQKYPDKKFVIVGGKPSTFTEFEKNHINNLIYTGYVSNDELFSLYKYARGFIFPSFYEGFGLPPLEAITMGVKHIGVSNIEVLKEIYNRGVYYFNPNSIKDFDIEILDNTELSTLDLQYYLENYNWKKTANIIYKTIITNIK